MNDITVSNDGGPFSISAPAQGPQGPVGPGYAATSATSLATAGTGSKSFTTQSGLAYSAGARIRATSVATGEWMEGIVTSYSGTSLVATMDLNSGTGTHADWKINLAGQRGAPGPGDMLAANNLSDLVNKATARTNLGVAIGTDVQAHSDKTAVLAALTWATDKIAYFTSADAAETTTLTSVARTLLLQTTQALMRTTGLGFTAAGDALAIAADVAAQRSILSVEATHNFIENGNFASWQRGTSFTSAAGAGVRSADWWYGGPGAGSAVFTVSREVFPANQTDVPGSPQWFFRAAWSARPSGPSESNWNTATNPASPTPNRFSFLEHFGVRNPYLFSGGTCTVGFWIRNTSANGALIAPVLCISDTDSAAYSISGDQLYAPSYRILIGDAAFAPTAAWQLHTYTFTVPARANVSQTASTMLAFDIVNLPSLVSNPIIDIAEVSMVRGSNYLGCWSPGKELEGIRAARALRTFGFGSLACVVNVSGPALVDVFMDSIFEPSVNVNVAMYNTTFTFRSGGYEYTMTGCGIASQQTSNGRTRITVTGAPSATLPPIGSVGGGVTNSFMLQSV